MLQTASKYKLLDMFENNCSIIYSKKEFSKMIIKTIWAAEENQWRAALSVDPDMSFFSKIHTMLNPNKLWQIAREDPSKRLLINFLIQVSSMKIVCKFCQFCNKVTRNYNMHLMLSCFTLLDDRENMLEDILDILDVNEYVLFEDQDPELQFLSLMGCVQGTSFENISFAKWKCIMIIVASTVYKNKSLFAIDCRNL